MASEKVNIGLEEYVRNNNAPSSKTWSTSGRDGFLTAWSRGLREMPVFSADSFSMKLIPWRANAETLDQVQAAAAGDPWLWSLSRQQRISGFCGCFIVGLVCLLIAGCYIPVLALRSRKFAILFTFGSFFIVMSLAILRGPQQHLRSMLYADRLPFTTVYLVSVLATLYVSLVIQSAFLTMICCMVQVCALIWYTLSYIPGGQTGLRLFGRMGLSLLTRSAASSVAGASTTMA